MSESVYRMLLRLYPAAFRERYATEMTRVFRDRLQHEPAARVWIDVLRDAIISIPRQHWVREPHPIYPASAAPLRVAYAEVGRAGALSFFFGIAFTGSGLMAFLLSDWRFALAGLPLCAVILAAAFYQARRARRASQVAKAYRADVASDVVTVTMPGHAPLTLRRDEVIGLHLFEHVGLRIGTTDPAKDLWVPARTQSFGEVQERLRTWAPVTVTPFLHRWSDNLPRQAVLLVLAALVPMDFAALVASATFIQVVATAHRRDLPLVRRLLPAAPAVILVMRQLW